MRTTIELDDRIFRAYKERAASRGSTFAREVEEALRSDILAREEASDIGSFEMVVFDGGSGAAIDVNSNAALQDVMDEEDRTIGQP